MFKVSIKENCSSSNSLLIFSGQASDNKKTCKSLILLKSSEQLSNEKSKIIYLLNVSGKAWIIDPLGIKRDNQAPFLPPFRALQIHGVMTCLPFNSVANC